jgi:hypothetical protein
MLPGQQVLEDFIHVLPDFATYWAAPDNLFREKDGTYTACGVFACLADFLRENATSLSAGDWRSVGDLIEKYFAAGEEMRGVLGACLIENMQFEKCSQLFSSHVSEGILRYFHFEGRAEPGAAPETGRM